MDGLLNAKPSKHHDFRVEAKGQKECTVCGGAKDAHTEYERVRVVGANGTYLAWRERETK